MARTAVRDRSWLRSTARLARLALRNWRARWLRTAGAMLAIAIGTGAVVWVTCSYESVRRTVTNWAESYIGSAHVTITSQLGKYNQIPQRLTELIARFDEVQTVTPMLIQRLPARPWSAAEMQRGAEPPGDYDEWTPEVDFYGIDLATEFAVREYPLVAGRQLTADDEYACVFEAEAAGQAGLVVGDYLLVFTETQPDPYALEIVGLFERRRIARFQKPVALVRLPVLQDMRSKFALVSNVDVVLKDPSQQSVRRFAAKLRPRVAAVARSALLRSAEGRMKQIEAAQDQQRTLLLLLSSVALLTALFIILSTLSMGMVERIGQLGLLRCVGITRGQLALLVLFEVVPLGVIGLVAGVPLGLGLAELTAWLVPDYVGDFPISFADWRQAAGEGLGPAVRYAWDAARRTGILTATVAGLATTLVAALLPMFAALGVSPLEASRPRARRSPAVLPVLVAGVAVILLLVQHLGIIERVARSTWFVNVAALATALLYFGYALLAPVVVRWIGTPAVAAAAALLRVRFRLLQDQVGHAVWRSAGICCGLMVGLSLIVAIIVINESVTRGWQFPKDFPEAYVWAREQMDPDAAELIADVPGIRDFTVANAVNVIVEERPWFMEQVMLSVTWFLGTEPESFLRMGRLDFVEGDEQSALQQLEEGGHVIVADDFSRSRDKHLGDEVRVFYGSMVRTFRIAGVVRSPAIDIAAGWFQAHAEYHVAASGSVIGTNADLERMFGIRGTRLILLNFDLSRQTVPEDWPPPYGDPEGGRVGAAVHRGELTREAGWERWREQEVLRVICRRLGISYARAGTVRELKDEIDQQLTEMTRLLTAIPVVALLVAAIGVANMMTANVAARVRQFAILRAVGATRGLVLRMVVGEAVVLGLLGSGLGLALGLHLASNVTTLVDSMWGFRVNVALPWGYIAAAAGLTVSLCIVAGIIPARSAARTDVVSALHVT